MKAVITIGISGSGKSTWARAQGGVPVLNGVWGDAPYVIVERDAVRESLQNRTPEQGVDWSSWDWSREGEVTGACRELIRDAAGTRRDVIIADTNLRADFRAELVEYLEARGYTVSFKVFVVSPDECVRRDALRPSPVGEDAVRRQAALFDAIFASEEVTAALKARPR